MQRKGECISKIVFDVTQCSPTTTQQQRNNSNRSSTDNLWFNDDPLRCQEVP